MDGFLSNIIDKDVEHTPKVSMAVNEGLATRQLNKVTEIMTSIINSGMRATPEDLTFEGIRILTPDETVNILYPKESSSYKFFDTSISDTYLVELLFKWQGEKLGAFTYFPFATDGGMIKLSDTTYSISPILTDNVFSIDNKGVLIKVMASKVNVEARNFHILIDGKISLEIVPNIRKFVDAERKSVAKILVPPLGLYGLISGGIKGLGNVVMSFNDEPRAGYVKYSNADARPASVEKEMMEPKDKLHIFIEKKDNTDLNKAIAVAILYMYRHKPILFTGWDKIIGTKKELDFWKNIIGYSIFYGTKPVFDAKAIIDEHLSKIIYHLDDVSKEKLASIGIQVEDYFDVLNYATSNHTKLTTQDVMVTNDPTTRYMDSIYYIMFWAISGINKFMSGVTKKSDMSPTPLSRKAVTTIFTSNVTRRKVFEVLSAPINLSLTLADSSSDNKYLKLGSTMAVQEQGVGVNKGSMKVMPESMKVFNAYDLLGGSFMFLNKAIPNGKLRLNLFVNVDEETGKIITTEDDVRILGNLNRMLQSTSDAPDIEIEDSGEVDI